MKKLLCIFIILSIPLSALTKEQINFDQFFMNKTMRIDYYHVGDANEEFVTIDHIYQQGEWAGNPKRLIDLFDYGRYFIKIHDSNTNQLIYSKGFDSYFGEYKTTDPALNGIKRTYHETALIPYPKNKITFVVEMRDGKNILNPIFKQEIDPGSVHIIKEKLDNTVKVYQPVKNGEAHQKVDIAYIAEGYTETEYEQFKADIDRYVKIFMEASPYNKFNDKFNMYGVFKASTNENVDEPRQGLFRNTAVNASFNSLNLERYLLTEDNKSMRDIAAHVPYDAIMILVNSSRYGGGGIYNFYAITTVNDKRSEFVFLHEFGHSFAGLADEYYSSDVSYNDFYPTGIEPNQPNITALLDPENLKWKQWVFKDLDIPTKWNKKEYDALQNERSDIQKEKRTKVAELIKQNASEFEIENLKKLYDEKLDTQYKKITAFYEKYASLQNKVGAFEGAGYSSEGLYRPEMNCIMFSSSADKFCKVCQQAIIQMIQFYSD